MTGEMEQVTRLQSLDLRIAEFEREVGALPKHIAQIERALDSHLRRLEADRAALAANQKERKRLEDDGKAEGQKISKLKDQMLGAKTNEQYRAFQYEIDFCEQAIRKADDRILDLMSEAEPLDANVKTAEVQKQLEQSKAERKSMVGALKPATYSTYERIRKKWHGSAVAEVLEGRCTACQIQLRPQFFQDLRHSEHMMQCESCGRILYYNPPVSFEHDLAAPQHP